MLCAAAMAQQESGTGSLRGQVTDPTGAVVVGAKVSVTASDGTVRKATTDAQGNYVVRGLAEGALTVGATADGFAEFEMQNVVLRAGETQRRDIALAIATKHEAITVESENGGPQLDVSPENNAGALVLKGEELEALPDDPDELQQDLQALAGPTAGPNGAQIYVDGFSGGRLPPKSSIREIRINQNPFSAEFDKPGYGHVEVFTKPGTDKWHGQAAINENHSVFNSRNPYVHGEVPDYHSEIYSGNVSGALRKDLSLFLDAQRRNISELAVVTAIPDIVPEGLALPSPRTRNNMSGRIDWQATANNTLTARYQFESNDEENQGVGGITLPSRGFVSSEAEHTVRLSHTQVLGPRAINQTRFQFIRNESSQTANELNAGAAINVLGEFNAGASTVGRSSDNINRYELQNLTSWSAGKHFVRFGGRLRVVQDTSISQSNFSGTITYSSLADYLNGTASQLSFVTGGLRTAFTFADVGVYVEDDWKLRPNLTLSYGLRFESQSAIADKADFAPRLGLAWGLDGGKTAPKTVLRFGWGIFYDRFSDDLVLQAQRLNGVTQTETIANATSGPIKCPPGTLPPTAIDVSQCSFSGADTIYRINRNLRSPYTMQAAVGVERQLGKVGSLSLNYLHSRGVHQLILLNANAPLPGQGDETRPFFSTLGTQNIYEYNSAAVFRQNQIIANLQLRVGKRVSLTGYYTLGWANSNTGGPNSSPSNQYDLSQDYGRASYDVRHKLFFSGTASLAYNFRISPFVIINSGAPFNITTGRDNGSTFLNERPSFGVPGAPGVITTKYGSFNVNPAPDEPRIPINYGSGPANVTVNVRLSKTFGFGAETGEDGDGPRASRASRGRRGGDGGRGGGASRGGFGGPAPHGFGGLFVPGGTSRRFNLTLTVVARNVFNFWNPGPPIGNLSSTKFGESVSLAGGPFSSGAASRRLDFQAMFAF
jgi:carboxypeptidase family protein